MVDFAARKQEFFRELSANEDAQVFLAVLDYYDGLKNKQAKPLRKKRAKSVRKRTVAERPASEISERAESLGTVTVFENPQPAKFSLARMQGITVEEVEQRAKELRKVLAKPLRKTIDFETLKREQNLKPRDPAKMMAMLDEIDVPETIEELLAQLTK